MNVADHYHILQMSRRRFKGLKAFPESTRECEEALGSPCCWHWGWVGVTEAYLGSGSRSPKPIWTVEARSTWGEDQGPPGQCPAETPSLPPTWPILSLFLPPPATAGPGELRPSLQRSREERCGSGRKLGLGGTGAQPDKSSSTQFFLEIPHTLGVWQDPGMCFI